MNLHRGRKIQVESGRANLGNDCKRAKSADIQFRRRTSSRNVSAQEPRFVAWDKRWGPPTTPIGRCLHSLARLQELALYNFLSHLKSLHIGVGSMNCRVWRCRQQGHARVKPVVREERGQSRGRMSGIIVAKFCHGKECGPISLLEVRVDPEIVL